MTVEEGMDSDERSSLLPAESEELVPEAESNHSGVDKSFSSAANQEQAAEDYGRLQVGLAGEGASCRDGTVRIPLEIMVGGESRRLVVSVSIE
jgi:hypothetical protein